MKNSEGFIDDSIEYCSIDDGTFEELIGLIEPSESFFRLDLIHKGHAVAKISLN